MHMTHNPDDDLLMIRLNPGAATSEASFDDGTIMGFNADGLPAYILIADAQTRGLLPVKSSTAGAQSFTIPADLNRPDAAIAADMGITVEKLRNMRRACPDILPPHLRLVE